MTYREAMKTCIDGYSLLVTDLDQTGNVIERFRVVCSLNDRNVVAFPFSVLGDPDGRLTGNFDFRADYIYSILIDTVKEVGCEF